MSGRAAIAAASLLILGLAAVGVVRSPYFAADHLTVEGADRLTPARVLRIGGLEPGQNVVTMDTDAAERRLEADPWIASASVTTELPDRVVVRIDERAPVAAVRTLEGWDVVAADGVVLDSASRQPRLPTITSVVPGQDLAALGARALGAMDRSLRATVTSLTVGADDVVRLVMDDGVTVSYGTLDEPASKAQALAAVLAWAEDAGARVEAIDVSVPGAPTARLAGGTQVTP
ncbi:MAG: FtsQ-type POTRA domain-containing protein [Actinomycetota bacterium]